ncbi:MAG: S-methyl-5-thioribose-1-phosphate isomerase [Opitutaceae bacterium]|nr:S-methyl-5-thioribose-1-phosphate isomerase [Opitutaceae bacterium]
MKIDGVPYRTIWLDPDGWTVCLIDQTFLPHAFTIARTRTADAIAQAIVTMQVRGAPLIGIAGAYGLALALRQDPGDDALNAAAHQLIATRPTGANLRWAVEKVRSGVSALPPKQRAAEAYRLAGLLADEDVAINRAIGEHGLPLFRALASRKPPGERLNVLTHCNAGWLATVDWGTALAPLFFAHDSGLPLHIWVDETRPRNQGAALTAWELARHGIPHTVVADNAGGHLMQHGQVDAVIVGTDRVTADGDVANKIGTYLKALAARDNGVPFYVALPSPTIDWTRHDGVREIPVEERSAHEVTHLRGVDAGGQWREIRLTPAESPAANPSFDVTPARLVTALITERGVCPASRAGLRSLFDTSATRG